MALITLSKQYARHPARPVHDMVRIFADSTPAEVWVVTFPLTQTQYVVNVSQSIEVAVCMFALSLTYKCASSF